MFNVPYGGPYAGKPHFADIERMKYLSNMNNRIELKALELMEVHNLNQDGVLHRFEVVWMYNPDTCSTEPYFFDKGTKEVINIL